MAFACDAWCLAICVVGWIWWFFIEFFSILIYLGRK